MKSSILLVIAAIIAWGLWAFVGKLATNKIGLQASFWNGLSLFLIISVYLFFSKELLPLKINQQGIFLGLLAGVFSGLASVFFYILLKKYPAGLLVTLTALYPLVTIILSVIFLKEQLTMTKTIGLIFALIALFLLNL